MDKNFVKFFNNRMESLLIDKLQLEKEMNNSRDKSSYIYADFEKDYKKIKEELSKVEQERKKVEELFEEKEKNAIEIEKCKTKIQSLEQRKKECIDAIKEEKIGIEKNYIVLQYENDLEKIEQELNSQNENLKEQTQKCEKIEKNISDYRKQYNIIEETEQDDDKEVDKKNLQEESEQEESEQEESEQEESEQEENEQEENVNEENIKANSPQQFVDNSQYFVKPSEKKGVVDPPKINTVINSIPSKILVSINEGKMQYQYEGDTEKTVMYDILEYKEKMKALINSGARIYDPFLKEFISTYNDEELMTAIYEQLKIKDKGLDEIKNRFIYNVAGSEDLGFKARRQLRKMVKMLKGLGLDVEGEESIKFSFKNDILKGLENLFKGTMKGMMGKTETQAMLHASRQQDLANDQMEKLLKRERNNDWLKVSYPIEQNKEEKTVSKEEQLENERRQNEIKKAKQQVEDEKRKELDRIQNSR